MKTNSLTKTFAIFVLVLFSLTPISFAFSIGYFTQADTVIGDVYDPLSLNRYAYARNNPVKYTDSTGHFIDILADIAFIIWDVVDIIKNPASALNWGALGADIGGAAVPGVTGAGRAYKALAKGNKIDKTADAIRTADRISDLNRVDNVYDASRAVNRAGDAARSVKTPWYRKVGSWFDNLFGRGGKAGDAGRTVDKVGDIRKIDFYGTKNRNLVPSRTPQGRGITPHAADRMANPPKGRQQMMPYEIDSIIKSGSIRKIDDLAKTTTYWNPTLPNKPQVAISNTYNGRVVTVIKKKLGQR